jgi:hypothetical protein
MNPAMTHPHPPVMHNHTTIPQPQAKPGFFAYHGVWAFGVRLFRKISFKAKATLISAAFLAPLVSSFFNLQRDTRLALSALGAALGVYLFVCFYKVTMGG